MYPKNFPNGNMCTVSSLNDICVFFFESVENGVRKGLNPGLRPSFFYTLYSTALILGSVGSLQDLRTENRWFDPRNSQCSFRGLMIVIAAGFIPLSPLFIVSTMVMWESRRRLGRNIVHRTG